MNPRREQEPGWVKEPGRSDGEPISVYARTYDGIGRSLGTHDFPERARRRRAIAGAIATGTVIAALMTVPWALGRLDFDAFYRRIVAIPPPSIGQAPPAAAEHGPDVIGTAPARPKATLHVGEVGDFAVSASGDDLRYGWTVDGNFAAAGPRFLYTPSAGDVGHRRVEVTVTGPEGTTVRTWQTRVLPPLPPRIVAAEPTAPNVVVSPGAPVHLRVTAEPTAGQATKTTWMLGDTPVGTGSEFTLHPPGPGMFTVRAHLTNDFGATADHVWQVNVTEPPPPPPTPAAAPEPAPSPPPAVEAAQAAPARHTPPAPPADRHSPSEDVRRWLERYAAAWRAHDVDGLRRMGQVTTPAEVDALRDYFASAQDLDVEVNLLAVRTEGDHAIVRFTRRDRFRDPAGRLLLRESPPIEKELVRTSDGFRIVRSPS